MKLKFTLISLAVILLCGWSGVSHAVVINNQEITLLEAIEKISKEYEVYFTFDMTLVADVKVEYEHSAYVSAEEAIANILEDTNLKYKFYDQRFVILYKEDAEGLESLKKMSRHLDGLISEGEKTAAAAPIRKVRTVPRLTSSLMLKTIKPIAFAVEGTVVDQDGEPLIGVNIQVKGTNMGASTDIDGKFTLDDIDENAVLVVSYIGYQTQEVPVAGKSNLSIVLLSDSQLLDEVVVVGYGTQKKVNLTGSVSIVDGEDLEGRGLSSAVEALQGTSANLNMVNSGLGEEPGTKNKSINIRGIGTLTGGGGAPYVLVDGMPMDINDVDPANIQSVSVLKDASASAIYGARAAYGVILITTKQGNSNQNITASYSTTFSWANPTILPNSAPSIDVAIAENVANQNSGKPVLYSEEYLNRIRAYLNGDITDETIPRLDDPNQWGHHAANGGHANNDMLHLFWDNWALRQNHNLNFQGGTEYLDFFASAGYYDEGGMMTWGDENFKKYNFSANINTNVTKWLKLNFMAKYIRRDVQQPRLPKGDDRRYAWRFASVVEPMTPLYSPDGEIIMHAARELVLGGRVNTNENNFWLKWGGTIEPIKDWKLHFNYVWNNIGSQSNTHNKTIYYPYVAEGEYFAWRYTNPSFTENYIGEDYNLINIRSGYQKSISNHNFGVLLGYEQEYKVNKGITGTKAGLVSNNVPSIRTGLGAVDLDGIWNHWATQGVFVRGNYNYSEKYIFEFNARYDGSSRFENAKTKWGFFPSGSVGYVISKEPFWLPIENTISMNFLKLRASYGTLGNQNVPNYSYIPILKINPNLEWEFGDSRPSYTLPPGIINRALTWEEATTINIGIDASFFDNRMDLNFDWFSRATTNMYGPAEELPSVLGTSPSLRNNAELNTKGFDLSVSWRGMISNNLDYSVKLILGDNKSTVVHYQNPTNYIYGWYEGQKVGDIWGYETEGFFISESDVEDHADQSALFNKWQPGDIKYQDLNGDGKINWGNNTLDNHGDLKIIGNNNPRYQFGFLTKLDYNSFDFSVFLQGVAKRDFYITNSYGNTFFGFRGDSRFNSIFEEHLDYWTPEGSDYGGGVDAYYPRPYGSTEHFKNTKPQTKYLQNAAYLRLRNIQVGYTISNILPERLNISKARVFLTGRNILTFSSLKFLDPESLVEDTESYGTGSNYPYAKYYSVGLNIQF